MSEAFESYKLHNALKLHFTTEKYDFIKFRGKTKVDARKFDVRKDRFFYYKVWARYKNELKNFYVSVFSTGESPWIGEMLTDKYDVIYSNWLKRQQSITKVFTDDVLVISEFMEDQEKTFKELLIGSGNSLPIVVRLQEQEFISLETVVVINRLTKFSSKVVCDHPFWNDKKLLLTKYEPFVEVSKLGKFASILKDGIDK